MADDRTPRVIAEHDQVLAASRRAGVTPDQARFAAQCIGIMPLSIRAAVGTADMIPTALVIHFLNGMADEYRRLAEELA